MRRAFLLLGALTLLSPPVLAASTGVAAAADAAGANITNTATASYSDTNSNNYQTTSNTVVVTVQNVPGIQLAGAGNNTVAAGGLVTDTFTLTNTGNAPGYINIKSATVNATGGATSCSISALNFSVWRGTSTSGTADQSGQTQSGINSWFQATTSGAYNNMISNQSGSQTWTIQVSYVVPNAANCTLVPGTTTLGTTLDVVLTQPTLSAQSNGENVPSQWVETTAATSPLDQVVGDADLDLYTSQTISGTSVRYTTYANNSGGLPARGLKSVQQLTGGPGAGVFVEQAIPIFNSAPLGIMTGSGSAPSLTVLNGSKVHINGGNTAYTVFYHKMGDPNTTWSSTPATSGNVASGYDYVGFYIPCGTSGTSPNTIANVCFDSNPNSVSANTSTAPGSFGSSPGTAAEFSYSVNVVPPTGPGAAQAGAFKTIADGVQGGNMQNEQIEGPFGASATPNTDSATADSAFFPSGLGLLNWVSVEPNTGAGNVLSGAASATYAILNGPLANPAAIGNEDGNNDNNGDFTVYLLNLAANLGNGNYTSTVQSTFDPTVSPVVPAANAGPGAAVPVAAQSFYVPNTVQNNGNGPDTVYFLANLNALNVGSPTNPITVAFYQPCTATCTDGGKTVPYDTTKPIAQSTPYAVPSGGNANYYAVYTVPGSASNMQPYRKYQAIITAVSCSNSTCPSGPVGALPSTTSQNNTYNDIYLNGFIGIEKSLTVDNTNGCSGAAAAALNGGAGWNPTGLTMPNSTTPSRVCPGSVINYTLTYFNQLPVKSTGDLGPDLNSSVSITENGTATGDNWCSTTTGFPTSGTGSLTYPSGAIPTITTSAGQNCGFTITVPKTIIGPGQSGTITYSLTVK